MVINIVYQVEDPITNKKYIGSKCNWKGEGSYLGSSTDEEMIKIKKDRPETLKFTILESNINKTELKKREDYWQRKFNVVENPLYWNKRYVSNWDFFMLGKNHSAETIEKIRKGNKGLKRSQKTKDNIKKAMRNIDWSNYHSTEGIESLRQHASKTFKGQPKSKEHIQKLKEAHKGKSLSKEHKLSISSKMKGHYNNGNITNGMSKKIYCSDGNEYNSITAASKDKGYQRYNINSVLDTNEKCKGGYLWTTDSFDIK